MSDAFGEKTFKVTELVGRELEFNGKCGQLWGFIPNENGATIYLQDTRTGDKYPMNIEKGEKVTTAYGITGDIDF